MYFLKNKVCLKKSKSLKLWAPVKLKIKFNTFLLQKGRTRAQSQSDQSKPNFNSVNWSLSDQCLGFTLGLLTPPKGLGHISGSVLCNTHSLSFRLRRAPVHHSCCCSWQSSDDSISKTAGV